jgi:hypothetical protein
MKKYNSLLLLVFLSGLFLSACTSDKPEPICDQVCQMEKQVASGPMSRKLAEEFDKHYQANQGLSYDELLDNHRLDYLAELDFDVSQAEHYQGFVSAFNLSDNAQEKLNDLGFVVVPAPARTPTGTQPTTGAGPADVLYRVFAADLPVFISADSILHAWHRSFDKILEVSETQMMVPTLSELLSKTIGALDDTDQAQKDALFYLVIAQNLLEPDSNIPASVKDEVETYLAYIASLQLADVNFMGIITTLDFSQFIPRGHYTRSEVLKKYFLTMMWLGRTDLVLYDPDPLADPRPREEAAARALARAMDASGATFLFEKMDRFYWTYVGKTNAITPQGLLSICKQTGNDTCLGEQADYIEEYKKQPAPEYSSRVFTDIPPISMRFFPQRFGYGSWVTSQSTTPRLKPSVIGGRAMAMVEDVAFSLGADRAVEYFAEDMQKPFRENLPATLESTRLTMQEILPSQLDDTVFNHWLEALMALSEPTLDNAYPQVMRTAAWHDRKLEAVLASWAEMRHDTILIVEQSTGGEGCQYPLGYVEPVPNLYQSLAIAAARLQALYVDEPTMLNVVPFFDHFIETSSKLATLAEKEMQGIEMSEADLEFLNQTVDMHGDSYPGFRTYSGWYPKLYWLPGWDLQAQNIFVEDPSGISEPIVADVHTDAENGLALEVGVAHPGLMIVAIDNAGDIAVYGGPASSFYTFNVDLQSRMTDEEWFELVEKKELPPKPDFATSYWAE